MYFIFCLFIRSIKVDATFLFIQFYISYGYSFWWSDWNLDSEKLFKLAAMCFLCFPVDLQERPCFSVRDSGLCNFPNPYQESVISPRSPISFYLGTVFRNQFLDARCVHCYLEAIASRNFQWTEPENIKDI